MKTQLRFLTLCVISLIALQSCNPKEEVPAQPIIWESAVGFGSNPLLGSKFLNQKLYVTAGSGRYPNATIEGPNDFQNFGVEGNLQGRYRFPVSDKVVASRNDYQVVLESPKTVGVHGKTIKFIMKDIDPAFQYFFDLPYFVGDAIGIDKNGTVLIPYHSANDGRAKSSPDFIMIKTKLVADELEIEELKLIKENYFQGMTGVYKMTSFDNFFQINIGPYTFNIDGDEVPELKHEHFTKSFKFGNEIISFGAGYAPDMGKLFAYRSDLNGENTQLINTFQDSSSLLQLEFCVINGEIIGYGKSQLFLIDLQEHEIKITELDNTGLEGSYITSVTLTNSNQVLVTSAPVSGFDLAGGFYKPMEELFKPKQISQQ